MEPGGHFVAIGAGGFAGSVEDIAFVDVVESGFAGDLAREMQSFGRSAHSERQKQIPCCRALRNDS